MPATDGLDSLRAILSCIHADGKSVTHAWIEEKDPSAKLKKLRISELGPGMILLATDEGRKQGSPKRAACMSPLFSCDGKCDQNRACDAVLIRKASDGYQLCYIELKSDSPSGYEGQFKSTKCFMRYVFDLSRSLCKTEIVIVKERFVVFHTDSHNASRRGLKTNTRHKPKSANSPDSPDKFCVCDGDEIRYTEFI